MAQTKRWKQRQTVMFFCFPPIWIKSSAVTGGDGEARKLDPAAMKEVVFQKVTAQGLAVQATRDGEISLDFSKVDGYSLPDLVTDDPFVRGRKDPIEVHWAWLAVSNVFLALLHNHAVEARAAMKTPLPLTPSRVHLAFDFHSGSGGQVSAHLGLEEARNPATHAGPFAWGDWRILERGLGQPVPLLAMEKSCDLIDSLLAMPPAAGTSRVELYSNANRAYCEGNLIPALLQAWLVVESLLHQHWRNQPNWQNLDSIFQVLNALSQSGGLSADLVDRLHVIRRMRNATVHQLIPPESADCLECLVCLEQLFEIVLGIKLSLPHWQGLASGSVTFKPV